MDERTAQLHRGLRQLLESWQEAGVEQLTAAAEPQTQAPAAPSDDLPSDDAPSSGAPSGDTPAAPAGPPEPASDAGPGSLTLPQTEALLAALRDEVAACRQCEQLACSRTQTVFGVGPANPRLCFFGEAPGADEDRQGEPFVGAAGRLLNNIIEKAMGLRREDVYILNVLKCRPPGNRNPAADEIDNCRDYFQRQLEILQPEFICCLGSVAAQTLLGTKASVGSLRGRLHDYGQARAVVTYHPAYLLRTPEAKRKTWDDIKLLMREMGLQPPAR